jgi:hypothetical protein
MGIYEVIMRVTRTLHFIYKHSHNILAFYPSHYFHLLPSFTFLPFDHIRVSKSKTENYVRFEVFTAVTVKNDVFWDVAPCRSCVNRRFGGTYRLHLQGRKIRERETSMSILQLLALYCQKDLQRIK